jgi:membrane protein
MADRAPRLGASLAFYTLLSLAPIVIVVIAIASIAFGQKAAQGRLIWEIQDLVGLQGAVAIQNLLKSAQGPKSGSLATLIGVVALFFGASAVVNELRDALNTIWHVPERAAESNWMSLLQMLKTRALSFAMVVGVGFLLLVSLLVNACLAAMGEYFGGLLPMPAWLLQLAYSLFSFAVISLLFGMLYKILPDVKLEWSDVIVGAAATSVLFTVGKLLIGIYLGRASLASTYGAAGSLVIVLVWVYYSAQIFFFGAEFTCTYTHRHGSVFRRNLKLRPETPDKHIVSHEAEQAQPRQPEIIVPESFAEAKRS